MSTKLSTALWHLASRNIFRHRGRSAVTLAAIAFGVAALIVSGGFVQDLYRQLGEALIYSQSGHLQVAKPSLFNEGSRSPERHRIADLDDVKKDLSDLPHVRIVSARLSFSGLLGNSRSQLPIVGEGVELPAEREIMRSITLVAGRMLEAHDRAGALIGEGLADELGLKPGDAVVLTAATIAGAINTVDLDVTGVFRSFSRDYDARALKMPLPVVQDLLDTKDANTIVILLSDTRYTAATAAIASQRVAGRGLSVKTWQQLNDFYRSTIELFDRQFTVLKLIILFMVALGVTNAVNMAVFERVGEFGTMRALGNHSSDVRRLIVLECLFLGALGSALGVLIGVGLAAAISAIGIPMPPPPNSNLGYRAAVQIVPAVIVEAFAVGLVATVLAGILPARRAGRIAIAEALRQV